MPAKSPAQQRLMGMVYSMKKGEGKRKPSKKLKRLMRSMSLSQLERYAKKPKKGYKT